MDACSSLMVTFSDSTKKFKQILAGNYSFQFLFFPVLLCSHTVSLFLSQNQAASVDRGLNRCAALLSDILNNEDKGEVNIFIL